MAATSINDPPVAIDDAVAETEGQVVRIEAMDLLANNTDAEDDSLTVTGVGDAVNGMVSLDGATITYEHDGSETTMGSFTYTVSDGADTDTATVNVMVVQMQDAPVASDGQTPRATATPDVKATASPTPAPAATPTETPGLIADGGGMNVGLIALIIVAAATVIVGGAVVIRRRMPSWL